MAIHLSLSIDTIFAMKLTIVLAAVFNVPVAAVVSYCYYKNQDIVNMMQNQSCITGELHYNDNLISTDYNSSGGPPADAEMKETPKSTVEMCFVFRYITQQNLSSMVTARSSRTHFGCDFKNWCGGKTAGFYPNVTVGRRRGDLYCCNSSNCNLASKVPQLPPPQICYKNLHHWAHHLFTPGVRPYGTFTVCKDPDSWCIRSRPLNASRWTTMYDCDNQHLCQHFNMTSGSSLVCRNVTQVTGTEELCCCSGHKCFPSSSRPTASAFDTAMSQDERMRGHHGLSAATVGCIVAFSLLGLVGGAVMVGLMYQRQTLPKSSNLTLTYSRIEDDDISDSIQML